MVEFIRKLRKSGKVFVVTIPKYFFENNLLSLNKTYNITIKELQVVENETSDSD